jgi:hypothetical protein
VLGIGSGDEDVLLLAHVLAHLVGGLVGVRVVHDLDLKLGLKT